MPQLDERTRRIHASNVRFRAIFAVLAVVVPLALGALFRRQELRLRALADHGRAGTAVISSVDRQQGVTYSRYRYEVDGDAHTWSVSRVDAPFAPGESFPITYLPEDPSLSRPGTYTHANLDGELDLTFQHRLLGGIFLALAAGAGLCHRAVVRMNRGLPLRTKPLMTPESMGRAVATLLLAIVVAVNFDDKVHALHVTLLGPSPYGLPVTLVASVVVAVLFAPFFWVFPHLMTIVVAAQAKGGGFSRLGIVVAVARAGPELRRSRAIVIVGFIYFVAVVGAWIAYADSRGV